MTLFSTLRVGSGVWVVVGAHMLWGGINQRLTHLPPLLPSLPKRRKNCNSRRNNVNKEGRTVRTKAGRRRFRPILNAEVVRKGNVYLKGTTQVGSIVNKSCINFIGVHNRGWGCAALGLRPFACSRKKLTLIVADLTILPSITGKWVILDQLFAEQLKGLVGGVGKKGANALQVARGGGW